MNHFISFSRSLEAPGQIPRRSFLSSSSDRNPHSFLGGEDSGKDHFLITSEDNWTTRRRKVQTWAAVVGAVPDSTHACAETESRVRWGSLKAEKKLGTLNPGGPTERIKGLLKVCRIMSRFYTSLWDFIRNLDSK